MFLLSFVVAGLAIGFLRGGSLRGLAALELRFAWLILLGLALQVVIFGGVLPDTPEVDALVPVVHLLSYLLWLAGLAFNLRLWPLRVLALGTLANFVAIASNGGYMPASREAALAAGATRQIERLLARGYYNNSTLIGEHTRLPFLGDILAVPSYLPLANVFSVGDVLIGLGALLLVAQAMGCATTRALTDSSSESSLKRQEG